MCCFLALRKMLKIYFHHDLRNLIFKVQNQMIRYHFLQSLKIPKFLFVVAAIKFPTFPLNIDVAIAMFSTTVTVHIQDKADSLALSQYKCTE